MPHECRRVHARRRGQRQGRHHHLRRVLQGHRQIHLQGHCLSAKDRGSQA